VAGAPSADGDPGHTQDEEDAHQDEDVDEHASRTESAEIEERVRIDARRRSAQECPEQIGERVSEQPGGVLPAQGVLGHGGGPEHEIEEGDGVVKKEVRDFLEAFGIPKLAEDQRVHDADDCDVEGGSGLYEGVREEGPGSGGWGQDGQCEAAAIRRLVRMVKKLK
jgi:hypothetical protein